VQEQRPVATTLSVNVKNDSASQQPNHLGGDSSQNEAQSTGRDFNRPFLPSGSK
jgi:hypothetical protein